MGDVCGLIYFSGDGSCGYFLEFNTFFEVFYCFFCVEWFATVDIDTCDIGFFECVDGDVALVYNLDSCVAWVFRHTFDYVGSI